MAGTKLSSTSKVQASTILEVLISMIFIIVVFGIAMMIYTNVLRQSLSVQQLHAQAILKEVLLKAENQSYNFNESFEVDSLRIQQDITTIDSGIINIHLTAYDNNDKQLAELNKMIIKKDE